LLLRDFGREEAQELGKFAAVLSVLMNTKLQVLPERFIELLEVVLVLGDLGEKIHGLLDKVFADNFKDLFCCRVSRRVEREILRIDDTLDEVKVFRDDVLAVVHDEDAANVELDVIALLLCLEEVEGSTTYKRSARGEHERRNRHTVWGRRG